MKITIEFRSGRVRCYSNATLDTNRRVVIAYSGEDNSDCIAVRIIPFEAIEMLCIEKEEE